MFTIARFPVHLIAMLAILAGNNAYAGEIRPEDVAGRWSGTKMFTGSDGKPIITRRTITFKADGTYFMEEPAVRGTFKIEGDKLILPNLYIFTVKESGLIDSYGPLIRQSAK